jgi:flagellar FliL protein
MATASKTAKPAPKAAAAPAEEAPAKKSKAMLFIIIGLVVVLLAGGGAAWFFLGRAKPAEGEHAEKKHVASKPPVFSVLEPFTVNLQPENGDQYLQVSITMQLEDMHQVDALKAYTPIIRGRLLMLLSSKKASEINTAEGKKKLSEEIIAAVNQPFSAGGAPGEVSDVFLTSFVIQ